MKKAPTKFGYVMGRIFLGLWMVSAGITMLVNAWVVPLAYTLQNRIDWWAVFFTGFGGYSLGLALDAWRVYRDDVARLREQEASEARRAERERQRALDAKAELSR